MPAHLLGALYLTLAASIWGGMYAFSSWVLGRGYIQPLGLLVVRLVVTAAVLAVPIIRQGKHRLARSEWWDAVALGFVGFVLSLGSQFIGTKWAGAANGSLITSTTPAFVFLFAVWLLHERVSAVKVGSVLLATAGVIMVVGPDDLLRAQGGHAFWGKLLLVVAGLTWALYTVLGKRFSMRHGALATTFWAAVTGAVINLPLAALEAPMRPLAHWPLTAWVGVAYIALVSTAVAFYLWNRGFELLDASAGALFFFAQPLVGTLLGWRLLGERLGANFLLGGGLIVLALILASREGR